MRWARYIKVMLTTAVGAGLGLYLFIVLSDPYDLFAFSPGEVREPVSTNQRFSFPALARAERFDSAIVGTSTTRLLRPEQLDALFDARFVNLSMNSATAFEQREMHRLFLAHHATPKIVIYGLDATWCQMTEVPRHTFRAFPAWMYDDDPWNDLFYLFNFTALEQAGRQFGFLMGWKAQRYGRDGYTNFLPPPEEYDLAQAQRNIYGPGGPVEIDTIYARGEATADELAQARFPTHDWLSEMLAAPPPQTLQILVFVPYHAANIAPPDSRAGAFLQECKRRIAAMAATHPNAVVLDFMINSAVTRVDTNYWDRLHFGTPIADLLADAIARAVDSRSGEADLFEVLYPNSGI